MLRELFVQNLALIEDVRVELQPGFCAWSGETGAGKTLLLEALGLLLGERGSAELIRAGAEELRITGCFELAEPDRRRQVEELLQAGLGDEQVILARRLNRAGRSYAYVNDQPVAVGTLRELGSILVDIHGQRESQSLLQPSYQLELLDAYGQLQEPRRSYLQLSGQVRELRRRHATLAAERQSRQRELSLLRFEREELDQAALRPGELAELTRERERLAHTQALQAFAADGCTRLYDEEGSVVEQLGKLQREAEAWAAVDPVVEEIVRRLEGLTSEVQDLAGTLRGLGQRLEADPERLEAVEDRLHLLRKLEAKYRRSLDDLIVYRGTLEEQEMKLEQQEEDLAGVEAELAAVFGRLRETAVELSRQRQKVAKKLAVETQRQLADLGMPDARLDAALESLPLGTDPLTADVPAWGIDQLELTLAANPGEPARPLRKVASGGELSRTMLALKTVLAAHDRTGTLVFDEIDANVGGRLGDVLGQKLAALGRTHQVICVTHLPLHVCVIWLLEGDADATGPAPAGPPSPLFLRLADVSTVSRERTQALGLVPGVRLLLEQTPFAECLRGGQALYTDWNNRVDRPPDLAVGPVSMTECYATDELRPSRPAPAAALAVPLRAGERTVGVLQSLLTRPSGFTRDQIQLLSLVADLLGPAISNCQLFDRLRAAYEELRLTQSQLIQAEKMRALGELASGMAHEFNNSLCGVLGFLELALLNKNLDPSGRGYLESARTCALDATETVRRVQDFARRQQDELSVQLLDLNELTRQTLELTRHKWEDLVHARGVPIELQVRTEAAGRVAGSPTELREVLTNLIFNAVDAMPQGGLLRVRTWSTDRDAYLSVEDTGIGIPPSIRQRLFEPFFTTKGEHGNGLGLSVVFGIVRRHRGEIGVESELGQGSTFMVRLPLAPEGAKATDPPPAPPVAALRRPALRVLVIEDDDNVRQFLGKGLTALGHVPLLTNNGRAGLTALGKERCDVVLTDLGLPGMSGEEVARRVAEQAPGTPVIVLTGWADQLRAERCSLQGVAGVLGKPVALDALAAALASVCPSKS